MTNSVNVYVFMVFPGFEQYYKAVIKKSISDYNGTRTHNHLVRKRTLNHLAKLAK